MSRLPPAAAILRHALACVALAASTPTAIGAAPSRGPDTDARHIVQATVERQLEALERAIFEHEAAAPRSRLLRRRFTVETFLLAGLVPQATAFREQPDLAPLWRFDFRDEPRRLVSEGPWPGRSALLGASPAGAIAGSFVIEQLEPVGGDDAVAIGGRFVATPDSVTLVATWCEPCLHANSVDFPILPEAFLLAWDADIREIATLLPVPASHREQVGEGPPALDQPEDLYDLFDGLRPLPWLRKPDASPAPVDRSGRDDREPRGVVVHRSWDQSGAELQRIEVEPDAGELVVVIHQPPLSCRWRSGFRYELQGDVSGSATSRHCVVPEGEIRSLESPVEAILRIRPGTITGSITREGRTLARLRWSSIEARTRAEANAIIARLREPFAPAFASPRAADVPDAPSMTAIDDATARSGTDSLIRLDRLDPIGGELRRIRNELAESIRHDDREAIERAFARHRRLVADLALDASTSWRVGEQMAERLAESSDQDRLRPWLTGPCSLASTSLSAESLAALLGDRVAMGRFGAAAWLASSLLACPDATDAPRAWAARILPSLLELLRQHDAEGPANFRSLRPPWWEPPGRGALGVAIADWIEELAHPRPDRTLGSAFKPAPDREPQP